MKFIRTAVTCITLLAASPIMHAQQDNRERDRDRNNANVSDRERNQNRDDDQNQNRNANRDRYQANNAAYQDGWNRGMQDGQKNHKSKVKYGHWKKNSQDRDAYGAGYNSAYQQYYNQNNNNNNRRNRNSDRDHDRDHR